MQNKYRISDEFKAICEMMAPILANNQEVFQAIIAEGNRAWDSNESDEQIRVTKYEIQSADQAIIPVQVMEAAGASAVNAPCLIYYHGGGFVFPVLGSHLQLIREYIQRTACKVVCVNYRLAPNHPFPKPIEDCYSTLMWTHENAASLGIDSNRIAVGGDSAGGSFAAVMALMARDKNGPPIAGQMLIYPTTDARLQTESMKAFTDTPVWNAPMTDVVYKLYLQNGDFGMRSYASPAEADSLENLPRAYVEVAEFDPLRDEGIEYAEALKAAGIDTELYKTEGAVHGFDYILGSQTVNDSLKRRAAFLNSVFA